MDEGGGDQPSDVVEPGPIQNRHHDGPQRLTPAPTVILPPRPR